MASTTPCRYLLNKGDGVAAESPFYILLGNGDLTFCLQPTKQFVVSVALPDGSLQQFQPSLNPSCQTLFPFPFTLGTTIGFQPLPGTTGSLVALDGTSVFAQPAAAGPVQLIDDSTFVTTDPQNYQLTLQDGRVLVLNRTQGLQRISDTNGNSLTIGSSGIVSSTGRSIGFIRDGQQRVTTLTDPNGNSLHYTYDGNGNLASVTDQVGKVSTFRYDNAHDLLGIADAAGHQPIRSEYDSQGRLTAVVDALGNRVTFDHLVTARQETISDRLGHRIIFNYDANGNVLSETDTLGNTSSFTYDTNANKLTQTDPLGHTRTFTYDPATNNRLSDRDPLGHTTTFTYNSDNEVLLATDPLGHVTTNTYDASGNLLTTADPVGGTTT